MEEVSAEARAALEALARTLPIASLEHAVGATIRRGTLLGPTLRPAASAGPVVPPTRGTLPSRASAGATLPRLEVRTPDGDETADLELVRTLGEGGMGVVWLARQRTLAREVAVKRLKHEGDARTGAAALLAEARATGALEHPSVVPVHALGADEHGTPLLVMKRIEGHSLEALLRDASHPAWPGLERRYGDRLGVIVEILGHVADALHFAHTRGIVHRDVKPENVMVGAFGEVYLVDWGIALRPAELDDEERTRIGIVGTPAFMAPEMVRGDATEIDARTDVYLLGATLHAAITGRPRHEGRLLPDVLLTALASAPRSYPPELAELGALANHATRPAKEERPESALAFREALSGFLRHRGSLRLVREAEARLGPLEGASPERLASPEAMRALTESRFALTQALREWPESAEATRALDRTLRLLIEGELLRRSPEVAAALAEELASPDASIEARIAALRAELAEARRLEEAARTEERERDPRRTARQRAWIAAGLIALTLVLVAMGLRSEAARAGGARSMAEVLTYDAVLLASAGGAVALLRRRLLSNRLGRQTALVLVATLALGATSDGISYARGADPRDAGAFSLLAMASVLTGAGVGVDVRFVLVGAAFLVGALVAGLAPTLTVPAIGAAAIAGSSVVLLDALRQLRR
jgi:serine/threonine-protein kinase